MAKFLTDSLSIWNKGNGEISVLYFYNNDRPYNIESENVGLIRFSFGFKMLINNQ